MALSLDRPFLHANLAYNIGLSLPPDVEPAKRRRLLFAIYLDFCLFSAALGLVLHGVYLLSPDSANLPLAAKVVVFIAIEFLLLHQVSWSPGAHLLSISFGPPHRIEPIGDAWTALWNRPAFVDRWIKKHESWLTLLAGLLLVNEGAKDLVRWTMWNPPIPFFGQETSVAESALIAVLTGLIELVLAWAVLRLRLFAVPAGILYTGLQLASTVLSWDLWDPWVSEYVTRRRAFQGLPVRDGEIEQMQGITPEFAIALLAGMIVLFVALLLPISRARHEE